MKPLMLFIDGSVNAQSKIGYGAYLLVANREQAFESLPANIKVKRFTHTSSTKLELQTLLWALNDIQLPGNNLIVYTDSQSIVNLPSRRIRLEQTGFQSKKNKLFVNAKLYQSFFKKLDQLNCEIVKVSGHKLSKNKDFVDQVFTLVDKAARKALRSRES